MVIPLVRTSPLWCTQFDNTNVGPFKANSALAAGYPHTGGYMQSISRNDPDFRTCFYYFEMYRVFEDSWGTRRLFGWNFIRTLSP